MSHNVALFRDVSDRSLRRTIMSCVWLAAIARQSLQSEDVSAWLEALGGHCMDERKRRNKAKKYHVSELSSRVYTEKSRGTFRRWAGGSTVVRDPLMAAFFGPATGGSQ